ncbi:hypothetical protein O1L60_03955 [Streptomyces diastatochromogenes]|nr:hypothetical protein [Streptomyces diastatochromogenes]
MPGTGTETGTETGTGTGTETGTGTDTETGTGTETGAEPRTGAEPGTGTGTGTGTKDGQETPPGPGGRRPRLTDQEIVSLVRPHVPGALARDGNEAVTRVQIRQIMRDHKIPIRNERLTPVLALLRTPQPTTSRSN